MKLQILNIILLGAMLTGCATTKRYVPKTFFPDGKVHVSVTINESFSTELHKFVELMFFNDNKEWVEIKDLHINLTNNFVGQILTQPRQIEEWISLRSDEYVNESSNGDWIASGIFSLFSVAAVIAEVASGSDFETSSTLAEDSDRFEESALQREETASYEMTKALDAGPLTKALQLPPGRTIKRWIVINTPTTLPPSVYDVSYIATGLISKKMKKTKYQVHMVK